jgi:phosphate transport system substrate-binding protein
MRRALKRLQPGWAGWSGLLLLTAAALSAADVPQPPDRSEADDLALTQDLQEFQPSPGVSGTVRCQGNGIPMVTMVSLGQSLRTIQPELITDVAPPSRSGSFAALQAGTVDVLALPYVPTAESLAASATGGSQPLDPERDLLIVPYAFNPIAIYVNRQNPIASVTFEQLTGMMSRHQATDTRSETWGSLGVAGPLAERAVCLVLAGRDYNQHRTFRKKYLQLDDLRLDARTTTTAAAALCEVGADETAFCIASILYATPATRILPLRTADGTLLAPTVATAQDGTYPFTIVLSLVALRSEAAKNKPLRELMRYAISRRAQRQLVDLGIFPITTEMQKQSAAILE